MVKLMHEDKNSTNSTKVKKVLMVLSSVNITGGVSNKIMDVYRNIDKQRVQFDFFIHVYAEKNFEEEIKALGGTVYYFGKLEDISLITYLRKLYKLIKNGNYSVVHSHTGFNSGVILFLARIAAVKTRIAHSRGAIEKSGLKKLISPLMKQFIKINANVLLASSNKAGKNMYGSKHFKVIPNALNIERFLKAPKDEDLMKRMGVDNKIMVLGHVGRFTYEKNHNFLLVIAKKLREKSIRFKFVLVGDGKLRKEFKGKLHQLGLENNFYFAGDQSDVEKYYPIFNILLFPSFHEGFGNVAVEAQVAKKNVIASEGVPREVDLGLNLVNFKSLNDINGWIESICNVNVNNSSVEDTDVRNALIKRNFDIDSALEKYYKIYKV